MNGQELAQFCSSGWLTFLLTFTAGNASKGKSAQKGTEHAALEEERRKAAAAQAAVEDLQRRLAAVEAALAEEREKATAAQQVLAEQRLAAETRPDTKLRSVV